MSVAADVNWTSGWTGGVSTISITMQIVETPQRTHLSPNFLSSPNNWTVAESRLIVYK